MAGEAANAGRLLLVAAALVLVAATANSEAQTTDEAAALLAFRNTLCAADGNPPRQLSNWLTEPGPCSSERASQWNYVVCSSGRVQVLHLEGLDPQGAAPDLSLLAPLQGLRLLTLANNHLTGAFPDVSALPAVSSFHLFNNSLAGEIPDDAFAALKGLQWLDISGKPIPSSLATSSSNLQSVNLSNNNFSGPIPEGLRKFGASNFQGNNGLCGPPLNVTCPQAPSTSPLPGSSAKYPSNYGF